MGALGIYVNPRMLLAFRASTTHAAPADPEWVLVSEDSMIGMMQVRELVKERGLVQEPERLQWTGRTDEPSSEAASTG